MLRNLAIAGLFLLPAAAQADPRDEALSAMQRCSSIGDRAQRLACYDSAVARAAASAPLPPAPYQAPLVAASAAPDVPAPVRHRRHGNGFFDRLFGPGGPKRAPQRTVAEFGSESIANGGARAYPNAMDDDAIDAISSRLANYDLSNGLLIVTLDNGQVWRQVSGETVGHLQYAAPRYVATISRGGSGAYTLRLSGMGRTLPVRRLR